VLMSPRLIPTTQRTLPRMRREALTFRFPRGAESGLDPVSKCEILAKAAAWFAQRPARCRRGVRILGANRAVHRIRTMCRVLGVSPGGYYAWLKRQLSARARADAELSARIAEIHQRSRATYSAQRIHAQLRENSVRVGASGWPADARGEAFWRQPA
jgi:hypothetical protein